MVKKVGEVPISEAHISAVRDEARRYRQQKVRGIPRVDSVKITSLPFKKHDIIAWHKRGTFSLYDFTFAVVTAVDEQVVFVRRSGHDDDADIMFSTEGLVDKINKGEISKINPLDMLDVFQSIPQNVYNGSRDIYPAIRDFLECNNYKRKPNTIYVNDEEEGIPEFEDQIEDE